MLVTNEEKDLMVKNLIAFRVLFGLTTEELSKHLGCTRQAITSWERNYSPMPTIAYLALRYTFDELVSDCDLDILELYEYGLKHPLQIVRKGNGLKNFIKTSTVEKA